MTTINFETRLETELPDDQAAKVVAVIENYINNITKLIPAPYIRAGVSETQERRTA